MPIWYKSRKTAREYRQKFNVVYLRGLSENKIVRNKFE